MFTDRLINSAVLLLAEGGAAPPLQLRADTLFYSLVIFVILLVVLFLFAWKPVVEGLDAREKGMSEDIDNARVANEKAQASLKQYEAQLAGAEEEAKAVIAEARKDAAAAKEKILADAQDEAAKIKERAFADIESAKTAAVRELAELSVDSAVTLAGNIVGRSLDKGDHQKLIDDSVNNFAGA